MTLVRLWPRLPLPRAQAILEHQHLVDLPQLERWWEAKADAISFAPVGGQPVSEASLKDLRGLLDRAAAKEGYPNPPSQAARARFDSSVSKELATLALPVGEAIRPELWAWVATILVPHLSRWRWGGSDGKVPTERVAGPLFRNAFGRLWHASHLLGRPNGTVERWAVLDIMGADQLVALIERPTLSGNRTLALAVGEAWLAMAPARRSEALFRSAMKRLVVTAGPIVLDALSERDLQKCVERAFLDAEAAMAAIPA